MTPVDTAALKAELAGTLTQLALRHDKVFTPLTAAESLLPLVSRLIEAAEKRTLDKAIAIVRNETVTTGTFADDVLDTFYNTAISDCLMELEEARALAVSTPARTEEQA